MCMIEYRGQRDRAKLETLLESKIEEKMRTAVEAAGGLLIKFAPVTPGVPDRILLYQGKTLFIELKRWNGTVHQNQKNMHRLIGRTGNMVFVVYGLEGARDFFRYHSIPYNF